MHQLAASILHHETEQGMALYRRVIANTAEQGENKNYEQAIDWVKELKNGLDKLPDTKWKTRFGTWVNGLRTELKRKRNFILLLDKHFAGC